MDHKKELPFTGNVQLHGGELRRDGDGDYSPAGELPR